jgi:hypothetical protein
LLGVYGAIAALAAACTGGGPSQRGETTGTVAPALAPFTITLAVPPALSPVAPVIEAANSVVIGSEAGISGTIVAMGSAAGGVNAGPYVTMNDTWSRGGVNLGPLLHLSGTLHAAITTIDPTAAVGALDTTPRLDPPSTLSWTVNFPAAGPNVHVVAGQKSTIAPGSYGTLTVDRTGRATLSSGTYYLTNLTLNSGSAVSLDQSTGPVVIYVRGAATVLGAFSSLTGDPPNLLVGYLGTGGISVGGSGGVPFSGAIVAPFTQISLLQSSTPHTGFFAAQDVMVDVEAQVQYSPPGSVVVTGNPGSCTSLLSGLVPPALLAQLCRCPSSDDRDHDGVLDCIDRCPTDPNKSTSPGICLCGTPDTDSDGDGVPDCIDQCPNDPNNTTPGICGCAGIPGRPPAPAGTACLDPACPQSGATCDGMGVCGNRATCSPAPNCHFIAMNGVSRWYCEPLPTTTTTDGGIADGGAGAPALTWTQAQQKCGAKGLTLTRINSLEENRFVQRFLTGPLWLGANDLSASGNWRWAKASTTDGDPFWSGGPSGAPVNGRFSHWAQTAPGAQQCAAMALDGTWSDVNCGESQGYACEFRPPIGQGPNGGAPHPPPPPGISGQPGEILDGACVPEPEAGLPATIDELQAEILAVRAGMDGGAVAANPPPDGSTCDDDPDAQAIGTNPDAGIGCSFVNVKLASDCLTNDDCAVFGANFVCRQRKDTPDCAPPDAAATFNQASCLGRARCGQIVCPTHRKPCDRVVVCTPGSVFDSGLDDGSRLSAGPFNPASLFAGGIPDAGATGKYIDPSTPGRDESHPWCLMGPQDPNAVKAPATQPNPYHGQSGGASHIDFDFDPDLEFNITPNPLALGETNLQMHAKGSLAASVSLSNFLGQDFGGTIFEASIGVEADRCVLDDETDTKIDVFGTDIVDPFSSFGLPKFSTRDPSIDPRVADLSTQCSAALDKFSLYASRAKKAFRDAQQLLNQYHAITTVGANMGDLCNQLNVIASTVPFFPGGNQCFTGETPEFTINRFIDYYQLPGSGQITQLKDVQQALQSVTSSLTGALNLPSLNQPFGLPPQEESQTILNAAFAIGPVPMVLQVDVFAEYGVDGQLDLALDFPIGLSSNDLNTPKPVARAKASVMPHASAGLSAFVGAGFNFGSLSVELGIEGAVTLGRAQLPVFAGAELDEEVTQDFRPLEDGVGPPVSLAGDLTHFGVPTAFKFSIKYDYGARVDIDDILAGQINAELHIDFLFFSRTWRKQIVAFNGFALHFDLITPGNDPSVSVGPETAGNAGAGQAASPQTPTPMGRAEAQVPLMVLAYLPTTPDAGTPDAGDAGVIRFDAGPVQKMFYDNLCCAKVSEHCSLTGAPQCCPGSTCTDAGGVLGVLCTQSCNDFGTHCAQNKDCCSGNCGSNGICLGACAGVGGQCAIDNDCCPGSQCSANGKCVGACGVTGQACTTGDDCCAGLQCNGNTCQPTVIQ